MFIFIFIFFGGGGGGGGGNHVLIDAHLAWLTQKKEKKSYFKHITEYICDGDTQVRFVHVLSQGCIDRRLYMWRSSAL